MRRRHTRQTDRELAGATVQRSVRLPTSQVSAVQEALDHGVPDVHNLTDVVTDALWLWLYEQTTLGWKSMYGPVTIGSGEGEPHKFVPIEFDPADEIIGTEVIDVARPDSNGRPAWKDVDPSLLEDS